MDHHQARNLLAIVLKELGENHEAEALLLQTAELDPLDNCCNFLRGTLGDISAHEHMDIALELARAGLWHLAIAALPQAGHAVRKSIDRGTAPLIWYYRAYFQQQSGDHALAKKSWQTAAKANPDWCFPSRLEDIAILEMAMKFNPADGYAPYYLGNLFYDRKRHQEAIKLWEKAARIIPHYSVLWRNLGVAYFNVRHNSVNAARAYRKARQCNGSDARLLYEQDQLAKRTGVPAGRRLAELQRQRALVLQRDDLAIEYCTLLNQLGRPEEALAVLTSREFQPWEGGEGLVLAQYVRANLALGRGALCAGEPCKALDYFQAALKPPETLGEARHPLANCSDIYYYTGLAEAALQRKPQARQWWRRAAASQGDFQQMAVKTYSEMTFYRVLAMQQLGQVSAAERLLDAVAAYAETLQKTPATIDYFATSLPALLLFDADLQARQTTDGLFLKAQVHFARRQYQQARELLTKVLDMEPHHGLAVDLLSEIPNEATKRPHRRWTYPSNGTVKRKRKSR
jgi:tetratricopeptide (TPR) repeat protein